MIRSNSDGTYTVVAETTGREFGTYHSRTEAEDRLHQIEHFKKSARHSFVEAALECVATALESGNADELEARLTKLADDYTAPELLLKVDEDQRMVWGWASVSTEGGQASIDKQNDYVPIHELQKAVHGHFINTRIGKTMHKGRKTHEIVDTIVFTKELQKALGVELPYEGWFVGVKVHDDKTWEQVKKGKFRAFSIGGTGERHPMRKLAAKGEGEQDGETPSSQLSPFAEFLAKYNHHHDNSGKFSSSGGGGGGGGGDRPYAPYKNVPLSGGTNGPRAQARAREEHNARVAASNAVPKPPTQDAYNGNTAIHPQSEPAAIMRQMHAAAQQGDHQMVHRQIERVQRQIPMGATLHVMNTPAAYGKQLLSHKAKELADEGASVRLHNGDTGVVTQHNSDRVKVDTGKYEQWFHMKDVLEHWNLNKSLSPFAETLAKYNHHHDQSVKFSSSGGGGGGFHEQKGFPKPT